MHRYISNNRFAKKAHQLLEALNSSIDFDKRLFRQDIRGSLAHAQMLAACGIISKEDEVKITEGLKKIEQDIAEGKFQFSQALEDIHMNIEQALADYIGADIAGKLHTARSRNDQVSLDLRLYMREEIDELIDVIRQGQKQLAQLALEHSDSLMPGWTHLQIAQVISFGHHCLAYVEMLERDKTRLSDARARLNESPLGAAALAGTSFPIDRHQTAKALGFDRPSANALDAVSDRDFVMESLAALSICAVHLSRLGEEITLWASPAFNFVRLSDDFSTGSSIMPQKRNPDPAELIRAKSGRVFGALVDMLVVMKSLPLAYAKDMQQDKEAVFSAFDEMKLCLLAFTALLENIEVNQEAMAHLAALGYPTATDLADWLVQKKSIPFRQAHSIVAECVARVEKKSVPLEELSEAEMLEISEHLTSDCKSVLSLENSIKSKTSFGGTAPDNVRVAAKNWIEKL
jgi:argininosuccinate lyase